MIFLTAVANPQAAVQMELVLESFSKAAVKCILIGGCVICPTCFVTGVSLINPHM